MDLDKQLKAVLGWLYSAENKDDLAIKNAMAILNYTIKTLQQKGIKNV